MKLSLEEQLRENVGGHLRIDRLDQQMNLIDTPVDDCNLILNKGLQVIIDNLFDDSNFFPITDMKLGDDTGTGTQQDPESPSVTYDENTMSVVYTSQQGNAVTVNKNTNYQLTFNWIIFGYEVLDLPEYQDQDSVEFTSAALHANDGRIFAYRRFPVVSISDIINFSISWSIYYNV